MPFLGGKLRLTVASATNCIDYLEQFYLPSTKQHFPAISSLGILFRRKVRGFHHLDLQLLTIFQLKSCPMYLGWWKTAYVTNLQCQWEIWEYRFQTKKSLWFGVLGCWLGPISMARCSHLWTLTPSGTFSSFSCSINLCRLGSWWLKNCQANKHVLTWRKWRALKPIESSTVNLCTVNLVVSYY